MMQGLGGKYLNGGTTISGTMILAHAAGIKVFATGGLGGVHRGGESSLDISADLTELGRTPVAVISAGCKSFLDLPRTLEYLETQGVCVGTFSDGRDGPVDLPAFYVRESGIKSPRTIKDETEAAAIIYAKSRIPIHSGLWFAGPVPAKDSLTKEEVDDWVKVAVDEAETKGIYGAENTPYILGKIKELSGGRSVIANRAGIAANVVRGTKVSVELAKLELKQKGILER
jgi:pseudouridylate synthase / pseudouridine kinase